MDFKEVYNDGTIKVSRSEHGWNVWARPAVATLMVEDGKIVLIEDKKTENDRWLWNVPGGMIEPGESSEDAARRECEEETSIIPEKIELFTSIDTDFPETRVDFYIGSNFKQGNFAPWIANNSGTENIGEIKKHSWSELYDFAINYKLRDPRLVIAILLLAQRKDILEKYNLA